MTNLLNLIINKSGLVALYPLIGNGQEASGNWLDLYPQGEEPDYYKLPTSSDGTPCYSKKQDYTFTGDVITHLITKQPINIKSVNMFCRLYDTRIMGWSGFFCFNGWINANDRANRFMMQVDNTGQLHLNDGGSTFKETGIYVFDYFNKEFNVTVQESEDGNGVEVFFDNQLIYSRGQGNGFATLSNYPDRKMVVGGYINYLSGSSGQLDVSYFSAFSRRLSEEERIELSSYVYDIESTSINEIKGTEVTFSNKETKTEANSYAEKVHIAAENDQLSLLGKSGNYSSILSSNGEQRPIGYYQSTVLINESPSANKRVLCYTNNGQLVDETVSDSEGKYRFDYLDLNKKYMFVAQYSNEANTPPDYTAVAADWQKPTPYGE